MTDTFYNIVRAAHVSEERDESMKQVSRQCLVPFQRRVQADVFAGLKRSWLHRTRKGLGK